MPNTGTLYLITTPLSHGTKQLPSLMMTLPEDILRLTANLVHLIIGNAKIARAFLKKVHQRFALSLPLKVIIIHELNANTAKNTH